MDRGDKSGTLKNRTVVKTCLDREIETENARDYLHDLKLLI